VLAILPIAPTTAFSPFSPVQKADLERVLRVDMIGSPSRQRTAAICAFETFEGVLAQRYRSLPGEAINASAPLQGSLTSPRCGFMQLAMLP
jgi:hypothetical protein